MNWANIVPMVFPVLVAAVGWMITSVNAMQNEKMKGK